MIGSVIRDLLRHRLAGVSRSKFTRTAELTWTDFRLGKLGPITLNNLLFTLLQEREGSPPTKVFR